MKLKINKFIKKDGIRKVNAFDEAEEILAELLQEDLVPTVLVWSKSL